MDGFHLLSPEQQRALLAGPALRPPGNVQPDFDNAANGDGLGYGVLTTCASLCALVVGMRVYVKVCCSRKVEVEDGLAVAALGVFAGYVYFLYHILHFPGLYVHQWNVRLGDLAGVLYDIHTGTTLYGVVVVVLKAGILLEWVRIFVPLGSRNAFFWTCHVVMWLNILFYAACTLVEIFLCSPRERAWNRLVAGKCVNNAAVIVVSSAMNLISDVVILVLPQRIIWALKLSTHKRVGISLVFAVGVFGCVSGALRMVYSVRFLHTDDVTYAISPLGLWCVGEITSGFFILCAPSIPKALKDTAVVGGLIGRVRTWRSSSGSGSGQSNSRRGLPSWYRPKSARKRPRSTDVSNFTELHDDEGVKLQRYATGRLAGMV